MLPMYNDVFIEDVTHRKKNPAGTVSYVVSVVMAVLTFMFGFMSPGHYILCVLFAAAAIVTKNYAERDYEITYTSGTLDIDVIYGKSRRKHLVTVESEDIVVMAKSKTDPVKPYIGSSMKTYDCISHEEGVPYYCLIYRNKDRGAEEKVLFEPSSELLEELWRHSPQKIHK